MLRAYLFLLLYIPSFSVSADISNTLVKYHCDTKQGLTIEYLFAWNDAAEKLIKEKPADSWSPWEMLKYDDNGLLQSKKSETFYCRLQHDFLEVTISPVPGNHKVDRRCGAWATVNVKIKRNRDEELFNQDLDNSCRDIKAKVISKITLQNQSSLQIKYRQ